MTTTKQSLPLVHIHAQEQWHWEAFVVGNREGLTALRNAIDQALANGRSAADLTPADGEFFKLFVLLNDDDVQAPSWEQALLPYTNDDAVDRRPDAVHPETTLWEFMCQVHEDHLLNGRPTATPPQGILKFGKATKSRATNQSPKEGDNS